MPKLKQKISILVVLVFFLGTGSGLSALPEFTGLAKEAGRAVVHISTVKTVKTSDKMKRFLEPFQKKGSPFEDFFDQFFDDGVPKERKERALGSGFIISRDGYVVTNNHVVKKADEIEVILKGGQEKFPAEVVGTDPETDLALIKIEADRDLPVLTFGDSEQLKVGQWVVAIGNPFGLDHTVTAGIISAKGRVIGAGPYDDFLQTDASINPGNSGGPLLNLKGEVIGINTAIVASGQGIGFAIPSEMAKGIIAHLKKYKKVKRGWLGVGIQNVDENTARALGMDEPRGALVSSVQPGDPADKAGIEVGDVIVSINGEPVEDAGDLTRTIGRLSPDKEIQITIWRKGTVKEFEVVLGERSLQTAEADKEGPQQEPASAEVLGLDLRPVTEEEAQALGLNRARGLLVTGMTQNSPAVEAEIRTGDVILEANGREVNTMSELEQVLKGDAAEKGVVMFLIKRRGQNFFRTVPLDE
ncbi:MAG: DegQ family serine endoprotease [Desulfohalobiaceae bacterium]|nr:DegQ family serine endoprotease [Desulfohalobiaceae bacterium]